jgi:hypothetical protein
MNAKGFSFFALRAVQAIFLSGCVTNKLWEPNQFARFHEPANPANLQLFYSNENHDVLVQYDECLESGKGLKRRMYWMDRNVEGTQRKPKFIGNELAQKLAPIPLADSEEKLSPPPTAGLYAITTNGVSFTLYATQAKGASPQSTDNVLGYHELPVYKDPSGRVMQILLTPPAVLVDLTIVGGVVAVVTAPYWWPALNDVAH